MVGSVQYLLGYVLQQLPLGLLWCLAPMCEPYAFGHAVHVGVHWHGLLTAGFNKYHVGCFASHTWQ